MVPRRWKREGAAKHGGLGPRLCGAVDGAPLTPLKIELSKRDQHFSTGTGSNRIALPVLSWTSGGNMGGEVSGPTRWGGGN